LQPEGYFVIIVSKHLDPSTRWRAAPQDAVPGAVRRQRPCGGTHPPYRLEDP
jgi:hypothetical protein